MTDVDLLAKKLAFIETCVRELRDMARLDVIKQDVREERFVTHTLQIAIQAALDVASHIVSEERLGEPETNRELFDLLARNGWLRIDQAQTMRQIAGFRNVVVHGYERVDLEILRDVVERRLDDLLEFAATVRARLTEPPE
jgi:uncharacterized protein YutE (UPF0331/DUF86 family)